MRKLRELLRLKYDARLPQRAIAQACGVGLGTVTAYLQRATAAGLTWPIPEDLDDSALEARLFQQRPGRVTDRALPGVGGPPPGTEAPRRNARLAVAIARRSHLSVP
jgi:hypothetical protein